MSDLAIPRDLLDAYALLVADLRALFGPRLHAIVAFGPRLRAGGTAKGPGPLLGDALALVDRVTPDDLAACTRHADAWHRGGLRMPLLLGREEFARSLDVFPLEYDDIIAHHVTLAGDDPFAGAAVRPEDLRRACEARAKGHLLHLRQGYLEARGRPAALADLVLASASPLAALLGNLGRLHGRPTGSATARADVVDDMPGVDRAVVSRVLALEAQPLLGSDEAPRLYADYLVAVEHIVAFVDGWTRA